MYILNQDRDVIYTLDTISIDECTKDETVIAYNIHGLTYTGNILLGTYDTEDDATQIITEIFNLLKANQNYYVMPDPADEPEDLN